MKYQFKKNSLSTLDSSSLSWAFKTLGGRGGGKELELEVRGDNNGMGGGGGVLIEL